LNPRDQGGSSIGQALNSPRSRSGRSALARLRCRDIKYLQKTLAHQSIQRLGRCADDDINTLAARLSVANTLSKLCSRHG
jgi:hypothetical protein